MNKPLLEAFLEVPVGLVSCVSGCLESPQALEMRLHTRICDPSSKHQLRVLLTVEL